MNNFPEELSSYINNKLFFDRSPVYFLVNKNGELSNWNGDTKKYGLKNLIKGKKFSGELEFLYDFLPVINPPMILPNIKLSNGISADIHLIKFDEFDCILLLNASLAATQHALIQQMANDMRLIRSTKEQDIWNEKSIESTLSSLLSVLDIVALEKVEKDSFSIIGGLTDWFINLFPDALLNPGNIKFCNNGMFLENFLIDAKDFWEKNIYGLLKSGSWIETNSNGEEIYLEATATCILERKLLLIELSRTPMRNEHKIIQKARVKNLELCSLDKEIQKKEVLIHCIIHDLVNPLTVIKYCTESVTNFDLNNKQIEYLNIALEQVQRMQFLINETLDVMSSDVNSLRSFTVNPEQTIDIGECIKSVCRNLFEIFNDNNVQLKFINKIPGYNSLQVQSEDARLERVLINLLENALRHSPENSEVKVEIKEVNDYFIVSIYDQGPGIEQKVSKKLFEMSCQEGGKAGKAGLGLYFCRISIERWGGSIGCENLPDRGARFWFSLKRITPTMNACE